MENRVVNHRHIPVRQTWAAILALVLASLLSCALVVVRAYYSGTTALASDPESCLGITRTAWESGGPVTKGRGRAASAADAAVRTPIR